jgi:hypothetical protein
MLNSRLSPYVSADVLLSDNERLQKNSAACNTTSTKLQSDYQKQYLLVMTACIDPRNAPHKVHRSDPQIRMEDYKKALNFWLQYPDQRIGSILFIENTGYPLTELQSVCDNNPLCKKVEFISLQCNDYPPDVHYGYAELNMLDEGLAKSQLAKTSHYVIKVTGRLMFPDLTKLLNQLPQDYQFAVDCRASTPFAKKRLAFVTTQLMIISTDFYERYLRNIRHQMNREITHIETILYREFVKHSAEKGAILRWRVNCDPVGLAAHWSKDYRSGKQRAINACRALARKLFPSCWI